MKVTNINIEEITQTMQKDIEINVTLIKNTIIDKKKENSSKISFKTESNELQSRLENELKRLTMPIEGYTLASKTKLFRKSKESYKLVIKKPLESNKEVNPQIKKEERTQTNIYEIQLTYK